MPVKVGKAAHRRGPRQRPRGVEAEAHFDHDRQVWVVDDFWFDEVAAEKAVDFFPRYLCLTKGEFAGRPFVLDDWQADDIVRPLFGWKCADGTRRYRRCYVWVARKNGKSELAAGIALLMLMADGEYGGEVYTIASNENQARIVFDRGTAMVQRSVALGEHLECFKTAIYCPQLNASIKPMAGVPKGTHGLSTSGLIGDEIHEWDSGDLYQFLHDAESARRQPLEFLISTAGEKGTYGETVFGECQDMLDGTNPDPRTLVVIYAAANDDDWKDPAVWLKANPALGKGKKLAAMELDAKEAERKPRLVNNFKRYQLNMWTEQAVTWLPFDAVDEDGRPYGWEHCKGPVEWQKLWGLMKGKRCFAGIDLSSIHDLSAIGYYFPIQPGVSVPVVLGRFYKPEVYVKEHGKRDKLPYEKWVADKVLIATPGNVVDYDFIKRDLLDDAEFFQIAGIGVDPYNATQFAVQVQQAGLPVEFFRNGMLSMSPPSKELERLVISNGLRHGGHPMLRQHAKVVAVQEDAAGNIKPVKPKAFSRIDGIVALVEAIGIASKDEGPGPDLGEYLKAAAMFA
jgi:phage terminase large subunit-like protein